jgi:hypothetical protein
VSATGCTKSGTPCSERAGAGMVRALHAPSGRGLSTQSRACAPRASRTYPARGAPVPRPKSRGRTTLRRSRAEKTRHTGPVETCSSGPGRRDYLFVRDPGRRATNFCSKRYSTWYPSLTGCESWRACEPFAHVRGAPDDLLRDAAAGDGSVGVEGGGRAGGVSGNDRGWGQGRRDAERAAVAADVARAGAELEAVHGVPAMRSDCDDTVLFRPTLRHASRSVFFDPGFERF